MPTIDNKIIQMTFDNKQFERGVKESLNSLEDLKKALDLDKSAQSLQNLERVAESFDISHISKSIDSIANRFSLLGNIGQEIFHRISKTAVDAMQGVVSTITSMPQAGMSKYEMKNKAVQMIQGAMPEKSLEEIEEVLGRLNEYTDLTSYDFATMAQSIGKFTAAGVDLEVAEKVMEGIANETASAGGEIQQANIAMYNFSQALSAGAVKALDWKSIENQNLATKEFKETIIDTASELGILKKTGEGTGVLLKKTAKGTKQIAVNFENFRETLSDGWFTSDVLIKTMEKYADRSEGVGKKGFEMAKIAITLTQALDAVKDAISTGWMTSFQYIFGNLEEAGELFTRISDALIDFSSQFSTFRNNILKGWHDGVDGVSGYTMAIEAMSNAWSILMGIAEAAKLALVDVFGELDATPFIAATQGVRDFTKSIADFLGYSTETKETTEEVIEYADAVAEWTQDLKRGMSKNDLVKQMQEDLLALGDDLIRLDKHGADGIFGPETEAAVKAFQKKYGLAVTGVYDEITRNKLAEILPKKEIKTLKTTEDTITHIGSGLELVRAALRGVFSIAKVGLGVLKLGLNIAGRIIGMFAPVAKGLISLLAGIGDVTTYLVDFVTGLMSSETAMAAVNQFLSPLTMTLRIVGGLLYMLGDGLTKIVATARTVTNFEELGKALSLDPETNKNAIAIYNVLAKIRDVAKQVWPTVVSMYDSVKAFLGTVRDFVSAQFTGVFNSISKFFTDLWARAKDGNYLKTALNGVAVALKVVLGVVGGVGYGLFSIGKAAVNGAVALYNLVKNSEWFQNVLGAISKFFAPVGEFFSSVWKSLTNIGGLLPSFKNFSQFWDSFMAQMAQNPIGSKFVPALKSIKDTITGPIKKIKEFVTIIRSAIELLNSDDKEATLTKLMTDPKTKDHIVKIIEYAQKIKDILTTIKKVAKSITGTVGKIFSTIGPEIKDFGGAIWGAITNFFGGDGTSAGEKISKTFSGVFGKIQEIWGNISKWISDVVSKSKFLTGLINFGNLLGDAIRNFFTMDPDENLSPGERLMQRLHAFDPVIEWIKEKIQFVKDWFNNPESLIGKIKKFFSADEGSVFGAIGNGIKNLGGTFENIDFSGIWKFIKTGLNMAFLAIIVRTISRFSKSFQSLVRIKEGKQPIGKTVLQMAISLGIIAGALWLLAKTPATEALKGVGVMTLALIALSGAMIALSKWANVGDVGKGFLSMAGSIVLVLIAIAGVIAMIHAFSPGELVAGLIGVGVILAGLTIAARAISETGKAGGSVGAAVTVIAMCVGIGLVAGAIGELARKIQKYGWNAAGAFVLIEGILITLGVIAYRLNQVSKLSSVGGAAVMLVMCLTIGRVVDAIGEVAKMLRKNPGSTWAAFAMVEGILMTLGAAAILLNKFGGGILSSIGSAIAVVGLAYALDKIVTSLGEVLPKIKDVPPLTIITFLGGIATAVAIFSAIPFTGMLGAAVGLGSFIAIVGSVTTTLIGRMGNVLTQVGYYLELFSNSMNNVDVDKISSVLSALKDSILPSIASFVMYANNISDASAIMKDLWYVGIGIKMFHNSVKDISENTGAAIRQFITDTQETVNAINGIQGIDTAKGALKGLGNAFKLYYTSLSGIDAETKQKWNGEDSFDPEQANKAFQTLAAVTLDDETISKIKAYAGEGGGNLDGFADGIVELGTALEAYGNSTKNLVFADIVKANLILSKAQSINEGLEKGNSIGDKIGSLFGGEKKDLGSFSEDIVALGGALEEYGNSIGTLNQDQIGLANTLIDKVANLDLPTTGGLWQFITGAQSLGEFAGNMGSLGLGVRDYADAISNSDFSKVSESISPIEALARIQRVLGNSGGLAEFITGTKDIGGLGGGLAQLGNDLAAFADSGIKKLGDDDFKRMTQAIDPISALAEAQGKMQGTGWLKDLFAGSADLATLGGSLITFGQKLIEFNGTIAEFDPSNEKLTGTVNLLARLANIQRMIQGDGGYQYQFSDLSSDILTAFETLSMAFVDNLFDENGNTTSVFSKASENVGLMLNSVIDKINEYHDDFESAGKNLDLGLALGLLNGQSKVINAAALVATTALRKAMDVLGVHSPSTIFEWIGQMVDTGFVNGLLGYSGNVEEASGGMFDKVKEAAAEGIKTLQTQIQDGLSDDIVITPVFDGSLIDKGMDWLSNKVGGATVNTGLNLANGISNGQGVNIIQGVNIDNTDVVNAISNLNSRMDGLVNTIANLRIVMDTNALVGQIAGPMDRRLGIMANQNYRRG